VGHLPHLRHGRAGRRDGGLLFLRGRRVRPVPEGAAAAAHHPRRGRGRFRCRGLRPVREPLLPAPSPKRRGGARKQTPFFSPSPLRGGVLARPLGSCLPPVSCSRCGKSAGRGGRTCGSGTAAPPSPAACSPPATGRTTPRPSAAPARWSPP